MRASTQPILLHALWDFSLFSHNLGEVDPSVSPRQGIPILANIVLVVVLFLRRDRIEPSPEASAVSA